MAILKKDKGNMPVDPVSTGIDSSALRSILTEMGVKEFELAGVCRIPPAKLSALMNCKLVGEEADTLRCKIESVLDLAPGALRPRPERQNVGDDADAILADAASRLRGLARACRADKSKEAHYCSTIEQTAMDVALARAEAFPSPEADAEADEIAGEAGFELLDDAENEDEEIDDTDDENDVQDEPVAAPVKAKSSKADKAAAKAKPATSNITDPPVTPAAEPTVVDRLKQLAAIERVVREAANDEPKPKSTTRKARR